MLAITIEFLHGTFRADSDGLAITGNQRTGEWPPSPMRLFSALVAADGTRDRCRVTTGEELAFLEACAPPAIYADPLSEVRHNPRLPRFVVKDEGKAVKGKFHQEYQARSGAGVRPGVSVAPRHPVVSFVWSESPSPEVRRGLSLRAARIGYLGCSDSPVKVTVADEPHAEAPSHRFEPYTGGSIHVSVAEPGVLTALDAHFDRWVTDGPSVTRRQSPGLRRLTSYTTEADRSQDAQGHRAPEMLVYRFDRPISGRRVVSLIDAFKATVLSRFEDRLGQEPPAALHGHLPAGDTSARVSYLALPNAGHSHSTGMIHGVALLIPADADSDLALRCRAALAGVEVLRGRGFERSLTPHGDDARPWALNRRRWLEGSGRRWATVLPAVHERRGTAIEVEEVARWCERIGLPQPVGVRSSRKPLVAGGVDLAPSEVNRPGRDRKPYSHIEMLFDEPVRGPVVIGSGRFLGLGLCVPVGETEAQPAIEAVP